MQTRTCKACKQTKPWTEFHMQEDRPKTQCKPCYNATRRVTRAGESREMVPVGPFCAWIKHTMRRNGWDRSDFAWQAGCNERSVFRWTTGETERINIGIVDSVLVREGSTMLIDLYPELYGCVEHNMMEKP